MTVVLDTSALLAHHRDEEGADGVQSLFEDANIELLIASVTLTEFGRRMLELGAITRAINDANTFCPPLVITDPQLDSLIDIFATAASGK